MNTGLVLEDWVRRLALSWPLVAVGTASGTVVVANLETGRGIAAAEAHPASGGDDAGLRALYGDYDGGGITALAFDGELFVSGGRDGTAKAWRLSPDTLNGCGMEVS